MIWGMSSLNATTTWVGICLCRLPGWNTNWTQINSLELSCACKKERKKVDDKEAYDNYDQAAEDQPSRAVIGVTTRDRMTHLVTVHPMLPPDKSNSSETSMVKYKNSPSSSSGRRVEVKKDNKLLHFTPFPWKKVRCDSCATIDAGSQELLWISQFVMWSHPQHFRQV